MLPELRRIARFPTARNSQSIISDTPEFVDGTIRSAMAALTSDGFDISKSVFAAMYFAKCKVNSQTLV